MVFMMIFIMKLHDIRVRGSLLGLGHISHIVKILYFFIFKIFFTLGHDSDKLCVW